MMHMKKYTSIYSGHMLNNSYNCILPCSSLRIMPIALPQPFHSSYIGKNKSTPTIYMGWQNDHTYPHRKQKQWLFTYLTLMDATSRFLLNRLPLFRSQCYMFSVFKGKDDKFLGLSLLSFLDISKQLLALYISLHLSLDLKYICYQFSDLALF